MKSLVETITTQTATISSPTVPGAEATDHQLVGDKVKHHNCHITHMLPQHKPDTLTGVSCCFWLTICNQIVVFMYQTCCATKKINLSSSLVDI